MRMRAPANGQAEHPQQERALSAPIRDLPEASPPPAGAGAARAWRRGSGEAD